MKFIKMKKTTAIFAALALLVVTGCTKEEIGQSAQKRFHTVAVNVPSVETETRTVLEPKHVNRDITVKWKNAGDKIDLYFVQGATFAKVPDVVIADVSADGKTGKFSFTVPSPINPDADYTLYGVHGAEGNIEGGKIAVNVLPRYPRGWDFDVPMFFKANVAGGVVPPVTFQHLGALQVVHLQNTSADDKSLFACAPINPILDFTFNLFPWIHLKVTMDMNQTPFYDLISDTVENKTLAWPDYSAIPPIVVPKGETKPFITWVMPNGTNVPECKVAMMATLNVIGMTLSGNTTPARAALERGKAYHLDALWNGTTLTIK